MLTLFAGALIKKPMYMGLTLNKHEGQQRAEQQRQLKLYVDDPVSFVFQRSMKVISRTAEFDVTLQHVCVQLEPVRHHLCMMRDFIPKIGRAHV